MRNIVIKFDEGDKTFPYPAAFINGFLKVK